MKQQTVLTRENNSVELPENNLRKFKQNFSGKLLFAGDKGYNEARTVWNGIINRHPAIIAQCRSRNDIQAAVNFARENNLLLSVKGGGHHVAGGAVCNQGLMIDLSEMKKVTPDFENKSLKAEAGATWGDVDTATQKRGMAVPGGLVSTTGIAGLTLGGGLGWLRRKHGLSSDNLQSVKIVTADGNLLTVNNHSHSDLFWAVRGGGSGFGIVASFEYKMHKIGPDVMICMVFYPIEEAENVLKFYVKHSEKIPHETSVLMILGTIPQGHHYPEEWHGKNFILVAAMYAGDLKEGEKILKPFRELGKPITDMSGPMKYTEMQTFFDDDYPKKELNYYWKSLFFDDLSDDAIAKIIELGKSRPSSLSTVDIWQMGGAIDEFSKIKTAFPHRGAKHLLGVESNWRGEVTNEVNIQWTKNAISNFMPLLGGNSYINFEENDKANLKNALGKHYEKLQSIKNKYDPEGVFQTMTKQR